MNKATSRRPYHSPVRSAQKAETRRRILEAVAARLVQGTFDSVLMEEIARAAGVGLATLYRYFPSREALLDALADEYFQQHLGDLPYPKTPEEIAVGMERSFVAFDADPSFVRMYFTTELGRTARKRGRQRRIEAIQAALRPVTAGLPDDQRRNVEAVIAYLASIQAWLTMEEEFGLSGAQVGKSVTWAINTLIENLRKQQMGQERSALPESEDGHDHDKHHERRGE
jgi:AcrR family transcriptional regulator